MPLVAVAFGWLPYVQSASFNCAKATTKIEKLICANAKLSESDERLSALYKKVLELTPVPEDSKVQQRDWVKAWRNTCKDAACLEQAYAGRISNLEKQFKNFPFKPSLEKPLLTFAAVPSEKQATIVKKVPLQLTGRITFNHDAAGGKYDINSAKIYYTIRYVWDLSDAQKDMLNKIEDAQQYVVLKGQLVTYDDGSKSIDSESVVQIFGQSHD